MELEEVVVTGTRTAKAPKVHPGSIDVIGSVALDRANSQGVADLLREIPGVQVSDSGQAGLKRIRIRGEESRRVAVLIDNQEVTDHREVGIPLTIDPERLERIEVVRGAGSVLYGSKAIGGVVNFISKKGGFEPLQGSVSFAYDGSTGGDSQYLSLFGDTGGFGYRLSATVRDHGDRDTPEGEMDNTRFDSDSISLYLSRYWDDKQRIELNYDNHDSSSEVFVEDDVRQSFPFVEFRIEAPRRDREKVGVQYEFDEFGDSLKKLAFNAHYQISNREFDTFPSTYMPVPSPATRVDTSIFTTSELVTSGSLLQLDWLLGDDHYVVSGIQYNRDAMEQERQKDSLVSVFATADNIISTSSQEIVFDDATINTSAVFVQDEWAVQENLKLTVGARHYWVDSELEDSDRDGLSTREVSDNHTIGALSLLYADSSPYVWRANMSQGYVYPSLLQLATGAFAGSDFVSPNHLLKPETSDNFELGFRYQNESMAADITVFYSDAKNMIDHVSCDDIDNCLNVSRKNQIYKNVGHSTNRGLELALQKNYARSGLTPYLNVAWMLRKNKFDEFSTDKTGWPRLSGQLGLRYQHKLAGNRHLWADTHVHGESASDESTPGSRSVIEEHNAGWGAYNVSLGMDLGNRAQYKIVMDFMNLTNKAYSTSTENLLAAKRHMRLKLSASFY